MQNILQRSIILPEVEWQRQRGRHEARIDRLAGAHLDRRSRGEKDPVTDFLFEYYAFRPSHLRRWSPGLNSLLAGRAASEYVQWPEYFRTAHPNLPGRSVVGLNPSAFPDRLKTSTQWILNLLRQTQNRAPMFGCAGLHEWAMVYKSRHPRHEWLPMRLSNAEITDVVETGPLVCSHFDAYRFFTPEAKPFNATTLSRDDMPRLEQAGCLHVNMDIYRWATKRYPWVGSDLIADAFELALRIREVDMRASPYDVRELGLEPIPVETADGREEYRQYQLQFYEQAKPVRARLIAAYEWLTEVIEKPE